MLKSDFRDRPAQAGEMSPVQTAGSLLTGETEKGEHPELPIH